MPTTPTSYGHASTNRKDRTAAGSAERPIIVAALGDGSVVTLSREGETTHRTQLDGRPSALTVTGERHDLILVAGEGGTVTALAYGAALPRGRAGE